MLPSASEWSSPTRWSRSPSPASPRPTPISLWDFYSFFPLKCNPSPSPASFSDWWRWCRISWNYLVFSDIKDVQLRDQFSSLIFITKCCFNKNSRLAARSLVLLQHIVTKCWKYQCTLLLKPLVSPTLQSWLHWTRYINTTWSPPPT